MMEVASASSRNDSATTRGHEAHHHHGHEAHHHHHHHVRPAVVRCPPGKKLVARETVSLDSELVGNVYDGREVLVLEEVQLGKGGDVRAKLGLESKPRGVTVTTLGWVTSVKDGERMVTFTRAEDAAAADEEARVVELSESMASRIARRRQDNAEGRLRKHTARAAADAADGAGGAGSAAEEEAASAAEAAAAEKRKREKAPLIFLNSTQLQERHAALLDQVERANAPQIELTASVQLGRLLLAKSVKLDDLMLEWDRNHDVRQPASRGRPMPARPMHASAPDAWAARPMPLRRAAATGEAVLAVM